MWAAARSTLVSQRRAVLSLLVVASVCPSGLNVTRWMRSVWPVRTARTLGWCGLVTFHNRAVWSWLPVANVRPSGLNATDSTWWLCPVSTAMTPGWRRNKFVGVGWQIFSQVTSAGADILYGRGSYDSDPNSPTYGPVLRWYRYDETTDTWLNGGTGKIIGTGWNTEIDVTAEPDSCSLSTTVTPPRPPVPAVPNTATSLLQTPDGRLQHFYVNSTGSLAHSTQNDPLSPASTTIMPGYQSFTGQASAAAYPDGRIQVLAQGSDSEIRANRSTTSTSMWAGLTSLGGYMASPATLVRGPGDILYAFAIDGDGQLWVRPQSGHNGDLTAWRPLSAANLGTTPPTVVNVNGVLQIIALDRNGLYQSAAYQPGANPADGSLGPWASLGGTKFIGRAAAVIALDGRVQVFTTGSDGNVYTQHQTASGFNGFWSVIPGANAAGEPSAVVSVNRKIELAVRGKDGILRSTGQTAPSGDTYRQWAAVSGDIAATDPTIISLINNNLMITARTADNTILSYTTVAPAATAVNAATSPTYTGGPISNS